MKIIIGLILGATWINFIGIGLIVACLFIGWGCQWIDGSLGLLILGLWINSSLGIAAQMVLFFFKGKTSSSSQKLRQPIRVEPSNSEQYERKFFKEILKRDLEKLELNQLREFTTQYMILTQELITKSARIGQQNEKLYRQIQAYLDSLPPDTDLLADQ